MCLDLFSLTGFDPMKREPWLSPATCMGGTLIPSSERRDLIQTTCRLQSDKAIYSASVLDKAMVFCARDCHENKALANWKKYSVWDRQLILSEAQSESVKAIRPLFDAPSKTRLIFGVVLRYAILCLAAHILWRRVGTELRHFSDSKGNVGSCSYHYIQ